MYIYLYPLRIFCPYKRREVVSYGYILYFSRKTIFDIRPKAAKSGEINMISTVYILRLKKMLEVLTRAVLARLLLLGFCRTPSGEKWFVVE